MQKTLGGDRLGSGKRMQVDLHGFDRSTHDLSYLWRTTMSVGTLVPFMCEVGLPGDSFDIDLDANIMTHPTIGPLFGSDKVQLDVFIAPIRLYQAQLHNNKLGIGLSMSQIKLPLIELTAKVANVDTPGFDLDNSQINPSCLLAYLGIRGVGNNKGEDDVTRTFNGIPILAYWEIYKNYYSNKQEEIGAVIHSNVALNETVQAVDIVASGGTQALPQDTPGGGVGIHLTGGEQMIITYLVTPPDLNTIILRLTVQGDVPASSVFINWVDDGAGQMTGQWIGGGFEDWAEYWRYANSSDAIAMEPNVVTFPLENIDTMRDKVLQNTPIGTAFKINSANLTPYKWLYEQSGEIPFMLSTQEGLGIKTYQSDIFNNWLNTEWIDEVNNISAISTASGSIEIDTIVLAYKVYNMLNRIAVSGGSYDDWIDAVYVHDRYKKIESPMYVGGLIKELIFQEVVSNSNSGDQPLGTLAGKGILSNKHKGGYINIKVDEPSYIIGIISITPRIDYSQGNRWDTGLKTMDDLHKPGLDEIGFQELITEYMAWWDTDISALGVVTQRSAGKQPAWLNYMTNYNRVYGNFAIESNEMFMTLNRKYEADMSSGYPRIDDLTTYIDPVKFNGIFAQTSLDAMNYWVQVSVDITARRKMSAKIMPNL